MDDSSFDDLIKKKLDHYEDPEFDPSALAAFRDRMPSFPSVLWYSKYRTAVFVFSSLVLFSLLNGFILWTGNSKTKDENREVSSRLQHQVDSLSETLRQLQTSKAQPSVFIIEPSVKKTKESGSQAEGFHQVREPLGNSPWRHTNNEIHLGSMASIPHDVLERLQEEDVLKIKGDQVYLVITDRIRFIRHQSYAVASPSLLTILQKNDSVSDEPAEPKKVESVAKLPGRISSQLINKIEDHQYVKGVGINIAPHVDFVNGLYTKGTGSITPRFGITAEWIVSPHWSLETSLDYLSTKVAVDRDLQSLNLPDLNAQLGSPRSAQISTRMLSLPVNLKYRWWLTRQHQLVVRTGYTPYVSFHDQHVYAYPFPGQPSNSDLTLSTVEEVDSRRFYGGTLSLAAGISRITKKKNQFEVALFYEKSLGNVSQQKLGMQLFGVRTAYSFKVK
jgi:hypothetical protein